MERGSVRAAMILMEPPQVGHIVTSTRKTRANKVAHGQRDFDERPDRYTDFSWHAAAILLLGEPL